MVAAAQRQRQRQRQQQQISRCISASKHVSGENESDMSCIYVYMQCINVQILSARAMTHIICNTAHHNGRARKKTHKSAGVDFPW